VPDHISRPTMSGREWAILLILAMLWGGSFFFNGVAVRELPSFTIVWLRVASAAAALPIVLPLVGCRIPMQGRGWLAFFGMRLLNTVLPFALIVWGQHRIASGLASILNATTPLFTVLVAHLLTPDEKLTPLKRGRRSRRTFRRRSDDRPGCSGRSQRRRARRARLSRCGSILRNRWRIRATRQADGYCSASDGGWTGQCFGGSTVPCHAAGGSPWALPPPHAATWGAVLGLGLLSTALAYVLYFRILATAAQPTFCSSRS
jgi:drug/metabolite transporter (DMT)-like permease